MDEHAGGAAEPKVVHRVALPGRRAQRTIEGGRLRAEERDHRGAGGDARLGDRFADAPAGASYQSDFAAEIKHIFTHTM